MALLTEILIAADSLAHHLRVARDRYREDARLSQEEGHPRLAEQFEAQAQEAEAWAAKLANAPTDPQDHRGCCATP